jgi:serine/threonine-protein kinase
MTEVLAHVANPESTASLVPPEKIRAALTKVLASLAFQQVDRLRRFLKFIVTETLAGQGGNLKEYVIGVHVFDRDPGFDPRIDPIVRVQARRLRARLERYSQDEGRADEVVIDLPRGRYTPTFHPRDLTPSSLTVAAAPLSRNTVEVSAIADLTATGSLSWFTVGLREEIIHRLSGAEGLRVLSDRPGLPAHDCPGLVVAGSVRGSLDKLRVSISLIDGASSAYLWSEAIDVALGDVLEVHESVASLVLSRIKAELGGAAKPAQSLRRAENLAARNLYLQGRYHLNQRTEESLRKAADFFEKSLVEDANYALAHSGLADAWGLLGHYGALAPAEVWEKAAASAATAVRLDVASAEAHTSLAQIKCTQQWDWVGAEREFRHAIRLDPRYSATHHWYAMSCLVPQGRLDEALAEITLAQSLDPVSSIIARDLAMVHSYRRDFDLALEQCDHAIELNPHFSPAWWGLGFIQEQREDFDEAAAAFERAITLSPESPRMQAALGRLLALSGKRKQALKVLHSIAAMAEKRYVAAFEFVLLHFALGQPGEAFGWLERACRDRTYDVLTLSVDPRFDPWRKEPRFVALLSQMGLCSPAGE